MNTIETKAGHTLDSAAALNAAERLVRLFKDPQPGLGAWCMFLATAMSDFDVAIGCNELEKAAPDLLEACKAVEEMLTAGKAINKRTVLEQVRKALAKAEGRA